MVYVECRSDADKSRLYGQLDHPDSTFVRRGGSSGWWLVGGPAGCVAYLYAYGGKTPGTELASPVAFHAEG